MACDIARALAVCNFDADAGDGMVLQILTHGGTVHHHEDCVLLQGISISDARQFKQLR